MLAVEHLHAVLRLPRALMPACPGRFISSTNGPWTASRPVAGPAPSGSRLRCLLGRGIRGVATYLALPSVPSRQAYIHLVAVPRHRLQSFSPACASRAAIGFWTTAPRVTVGVRGLQFSCLFDRVARTGWSSLRSWRPVSVAAPPLESARHHHLRQSTGSHNLKATPLLDIVRNFL